MTVVIARSEATKQSKKKNIYIMILDCFGSKLPRNDEKSGVDCSVFLRDFSACKCGAPRTSRPTKEMTGGRCVRGARVCAPYERNDKISIFQAEQIVA